jgi:hypothetical protein
MKMKKWLVMLFICAAGVIACGKKIMPESGANDPSKPANDKSAKSETQSANTSANTNTSATTTSSFNNMQSSTPGFRKPEALTIMDVEKTVYVTKCNSCHALKTPSDYTVDQMKNILKAEIPKAKLNKKEADQVTVYLLANAKK